ncbi:DUF6054 family protein [Demequina activiva]|uniref:Uncharacterized protein n=1 Tax=Demequina activiva TaxID=1582364 RepID=A0A919UFN4_9MICO|nr:DUF6054 family protein [Demequina activiva]GIG53892.1 hypothetical protein Dac01nite_06440 [Demequina activiva]
MHETRSLTGSATALAQHMDAAITRGSASATLEHQDTLSLGEARMILRTYERYSMTGSNRVTLSLSILAVGAQMEVSLTTSGGSEALFFKINTFGEAAFMDKAIEAIDGFHGG